MNSLISWIRELGLSFIPLFVAIDAIGTLPFALAILSDLSPRAKHRSLNYAIITALGIGIGFLAVGKFVFAVLGISTSDFLVAGGLLLFILALRDLVSGKFIETPEAKQPWAGIVPIGTPLVVGPATLTTLLVLSGQYAISAVLFALILNLVIAWAIFQQGSRVLSFLGEGGQRAIAKITGLLLAAIAVKMIRQGILEILL